MDAGAADRIAALAAEASDGQAAEARFGALLDRAMRESGGSTLVPRLYEQIEELRARCDALTGALRETEQLRRAEKRAARLGQPSETVPREDARVALLRLVGELREEEEGEDEEGNVRHAPGAGSVDAAEHAAVLGEAAQLRATVVTLRAAVATLRGDMEEAQEAERRAVVRAETAEAMALASESARREAELARAEAELSMRRLVHPMPQVGDVVEVRPRGRTASSAPREGVVNRIHHMDTDEDGGKEDPSFVSHPEAPPVYDIRYDSGFVEMAVKADRVLLKLDPTTSSSANAEEPFLDEAFRSNRFHLQSPISGTSPEDIALALRKAAEAKWIHTALQRRCELLAEQNATLRARIASLQGPTTKTFHTAPTMPHTKKPSKKRPISAKRRN